MSYDIYSDKHEETVGMELSRGELNQWLLDYFPEDERETVENWLYELSDTYVLGEWKVRGDILIVTESI